LLLVPIIALTFGDALPEPDTIDLLESYLVGTCLLDSFLTGGALIVEDFYRLSLSYGVSGTASRPNPPALSSISSRTFLSTFYYISSTLSRHSP
jgi:hypothetical protein